MKILLINGPMFNYLPDCLLIGFRELFGVNCVDYPRKPLNYGEFPCVYGRGFTIWSQPIEDIPRNQGCFANIDLVIYGFYPHDKPIDWRLLVKNTGKAPRVVYLDGDDDSLIKSNLRPYFKRELFEEANDVFPIGFGIPQRLIRPINIDQKCQLHQTHVQDSEFTSATSYKFTMDTEYYDDLARSYFGITMKKTGWDCMRHYEIMAAGTLVMFKDFDRKPPLCAPLCPHFISYTDKKDFMEKTGRLLTNGKPNAEYVRILQAQRDWLLENATCTARAKHLLLQIEKYFADKPTENMPTVRLKILPQAKMNLFLLKENATLRAITFIRQNPLVERILKWIYFKVYKRSSGAR